MKKLTLYLGFLSFLFLAAISYSAPLPVEKAFKLSVKAVDSSTINATWNIAEGYHLYRDQVSIKLAENDGAKLGKIVYPPGKKEKNHSKF